MFGLGMPEILIILAVALVVVGPKKLPDLAKGLGKGLKEFRGAANELKSKFEETETYSDLKDIKSNLTDMAKTVNPKSYLDMDTLDVEPSSPPPNQAVEKPAQAEGETTVPAGEAAPSATELAAAGEPASDPTPASEPKKFMPPPAKTVADQAPAQETPELQEKPASEKNE